jgi:hypothetical protein
MVDGRRESVTRASLPGAIKSQVDDGGGGKCMIASNGAMATFLDLCVDFAHQTGSCSTSKISFGAQAGCACQKSRSMPCCLSALPPVQHSAQLHAAVLLCYVCATGTCYWYVLPYLAAMRSHGTRSATALTTPLQGLILYAQAM